MSGAAREIDLTSVTGPKLELLHVAGLDSQKNISKLAT